MSIRTTIAYGTAVVFCAIPAIAVAPPTGCCKNQNAGCVANSDCSGMEHCPQTWICGSQIKGGFTVTASEIREMPCTTYGTSYRAPCTSSQPGTVSFSDCAGANNGAGECCFGVITTAQPGLTVEVEIPTATEVCGIIL
ncbi:MAG: hypothetical protein ACTS22_00455 [Phycisphaerales bacterium]